MHPQRSCTLNERLVQFEYSDRPPIEEPEPDKYDPLVTSVDGLAHDVASTTRFLFGGAAIVSDVAACGAHVNAVNVYGRTGEGHVPHPDPSPHSTQVP